MSAPENKKDSCNYAVELVKQFLTLATAGIAFVVGLVFAEKSGKLSSAIVGWSLLFFGLSIVCGWLCFMRLVGKINRDDNYEVFEPFAQLTSLLQILLFCGGIAVLVPATLHKARSSPTVQIQQNQPTARP